MDVYNSEQIPKVSDELEEKIANLDVETAQLLADLQARIDALTQLKLDQSSRPTRSTPNADDEVAKILEQLQIVDDKKKELAS